MIKIRVLHSKIFSIDSYSSTIASYCIINKIGINKLRIKSKIVINCSTINCSIINKITVYNSGISTISCSSNNPLKVNTATIFCIITCEVRITYININSLFIGNSTTIKSGSIINKITIIYSEIITSTIIITIIINSTTISSVSAICNISSEIRIIH